MYVKLYEQRYYYLNPVPSIPTASVVPVSIGIDAGSFRIETEALLFSVCPSNNSLSDFEDIDTWDSLLDGLDTTVNDPTILLEWYQLPSDGGLALVNSIVEGTACIVSDGSFNPNSSLYPVSTSNVALAPSSHCVTKIFLSKTLRVTRLKLAGSISFPDVGV